MKRTTVHGPAFSARPAPTTKYVHQRHATVRKPKTAPTADENLQSLSATPRGHSDHRLAQDDYSKQREALGDMACVYRDASHKARTNQGWNPKVRRQPDPPQQVTPRLGNG